MKHLNSLLFAVFLLLSMSAVSQNWLTNFDEAKAKAAKTNQNILLVFSGSDWCVPCMKLEQEIWQSEEFKNFAKDHFVLLKASFPKQKKNRLSEEQQEHNNQLAEKYNQQGYFPLVVVLNKNGKELGATGYKHTTPDKYIDILTSLEK